MNAEETNILPNITLDIFVGILTLMTLCVCAIRSRGSV
jgi:hypothetical protein